MNVDFRKTDGMFKGIYNGKQCHVSDIAAVLSRAWSAGVDRIIVSLIRHRFFALFGARFVSTLSIIWFLRITEFDFLNYSTTFDGHSEVEETIEL
jgi:hypothetical protein